MSVADTAFFIRTDISFVFAREENFLECCFFLLSFTRDRIDIVFQGGFGVRLGNISFFQGVRFFCLVRVYIFRACSRIILKPSVFELVRISV